MSRSREQEGRRIFWQEEPGELEVQGGEGTSEKLEDPANNFLRSHRLLSELVFKKSGFDFYLQFTFTFYSCNFVST